MVDVFIALGVRGRCSEALGGAGPLSLYCHGLVAVGVGTVSAIASHAHVWAVLILTDHGPDAAGDGPGILVDCGLHVGRSRFPLARFPLHDHHYPFALGCQLHAHSFIVHQALVAEGVVNLQVTGLCAVHLLLPLDQEAGAVPSTRPPIAGGQTWW